MQHMIQIQQSYLRLSAATCELRLNDNVATACETQ